MESMSETTQASDARDDVLELVLLGVFGLGPLVSFVAYGTGSGIEMGIGVIVSVAVARALILTRGSSECHDEGGEDVDYRTPARIGSEREGSVEEGET